MARSEQEAPAYITPAEIARILGVSRATVYSRVLTPESGLPVHYLGRRRVVSRRAFFAWFEGRDTGAMRDMRGAR